MIHLSLLYIDVEKGVEHKECIKKMRIRKEAGRDDILLMFERVCEKGKLYD